MQLFVSLFVCLSCNMPVLVVLLIRTPHNKYRTAFTSCHPNNHTTSVIHNTLVPLFVSVCSRVPRRPVCLPALLCCVLLGPSTHHSTRCRANPNTSTSHPHTKTARLDTNTRTHRRRTGDNKNLSTARRPEAAPPPVGDHRQRAADVLQDDQGHRLGHADACRAVDAGL